MTDDRLDLRLFESGEYEAVAPKADDVHTRKTLPLAMSARDMFMSSEQGLLHDSEDLPPTSSGDPTMDSKGSVRIASAIDMRGVGVLALASRGDALIHLVWQGRDGVHMLRADGSTSAIETLARVTALHSVEHMVLVGCENGEFYHMDVDTLMMHRLHAQSRGEAITSIEVLDDRQTCVFVCASGRIYIRRDVEGPARVRRLKRILGADIKVLLWHAITKEFVWIDDGAILSGDLLGAPRQIDARVDSIVQGVFSDDGSLLYLLSDTQILFVYSWVGDCRRLFQKKVDAHVVGMFVSDANILYGVFAQEDGVMIKPLT